MPVSKTTLVIGASLNETRFSNICIRTLVDDSIPTKAIGLREGVVAGVKIEKGKPSFDDIHTVTLYLNATNQKEYYDYIFSLSPKRIIFNPGTWNPELAMLAKQHNIEIENNCTLMMISGGYY